MMTDPLEPRFGNLIDYFNAFVPRYLKKPSGEPVGRRQAQMIAKKHNLPLVRLGNAAFIDPDMAAETLRKAQILDRAPRGRGRPRKESSQK